MKVKQVASINFFRNIYLSKRFAFTQKNRGIISVPKGTFATKVPCKVQNMVLKVTTVDLCFNLKVQNQF